MSVCHCRDAAINPTLFTAPIVEIVSTIGPLARITQGFRTPTEDDSEATASNSNLLPLGPSGAALMRSSVPSNENSVATKLKRLPSQLGCHVFGKTSLLGVVRSCLGFLLLHLAWLEFHPLAKVGLLRPFRLVEHVVCVSSHSCFTFRQFGSCYCTCWAF